MYIEESWAQNCKGQQFPYFPSGNRSNNIYKSETVRKRYTSSTIITENKDLGITVKVVIIRVTVKGSGTPMRKDLGEFIDFFQWFSPF